MGPRSHLKIISLFPLNIRLSVSPVVRSLSRLNYFKHSNNKNLNRYKPCKMNVNAVILTLCKTPYPPKVCIAFCTSDDYSRLPEWREVREDRQ